MSGGHVEAIANWLAGTSASYLIQTTLWIIPATQTIHILSVAMVFSSVVMITFSILGVTRSYTVEQAAHRFVPWIFYGVAVLTVTGSVLIVGEPKRSLLNHEFQMKMLWLSVALAFTVAFALAVRHRTLVFATAGGMLQRASAGTPVKALALAGLLTWSIVVFYGRWIAYTVEH